MPVAKEVAHLEEKMAEELWDEKLAKQRDNPAHDSTRIARKEPHALTYQQKAHLSSAIPKLSNEHLTTVINIFIHAMPEHRAALMDECRSEPIEMDIDSIPDATQIRLYDFVLGQPTR
ncbi:hypothetical protein C8R44DRAFT_735267 [Mycena epipterygia]|nr:hypothetical protein C8R44DRAFT_735267 [Mycena epipterygia]